MADGLLSSALGGLVIRPQETTFGRLSTGLSGAGNLISPYASTGQALAIGLGSLLMQGLSQYQAEKTAQQETSEALRGFAQLQAATTPEEQLAVIESIPSSRARQRLGALSTALQGTKLANQMQIQSDIDRIIGKEKGLAEFYATPEGKAEQERKLAQIKAEAEARASVFGPKSKTLPTGIIDKISDADTFATAARAHQQKIKEMSPLSLKWLLGTGSSVFGAVGDPGFVSENEAVLQLYRKANFGATLTGQEKKAADIISGKSLTASKADIVAAWDTLINQSINRARKTAEIATSSPENLIQTLQTQPVPTTPSPDDELSQLEEVANDPNLSEATRQAALQRIDEIIATVQ